MTGCRQPISLLWVATRRPATASSFIDGQVVSIEPGFSVALADGETLEARRLLIATGATDELPPIPGLRERWGEDFLHCPYCHGWEVRDQPLGVLGTGAGSVEHAQLIRQWSDDLVFFTHTYDLTEAEREQLEARGIRVVDGEVRGLVVEDDRLRGVVLGDGRTVERAALFVRPEIRPRLDGLLEHLGCEIDDLGFVRVDDAGRTSVPGVWAAGNAANPRAQVITAAGEGSAAAISINADLVEEDVAQRTSRSRQRGSTTTKGVQMTKHLTHRHQIPPPSKHQLALMIWLCVFPTLTIINLAFGDWLRTMSPVMRTFVLATIAVPIVIYGLMPHLHRLRARLLSSRA